MRAQLPERQVCHAPGDGSLLEVARDQQLRFVRVAGFLPNAFPVWIAPSEYLFDGIESVDHMMHVTARVAGGESVLARHSGRRKSLFRECLRTRLNFTAAGAIIEATKTDLGDQEVKLIVKALEHLLRLHAGNAAR